MGDLGGGSDEAREGWSWNPRARNCGVLLRYQNAGAHGGRGGGNTPDLGVVEADNLAGAHVRYLDCEAVGRKVGEALPRDRHSRSSSRNRERHDAPDLCRNGRVEIADCIAHAVYLHRNGVHVGLEGGWHGEDERRSVGACGVNRSASNWNGDGSGVGSEPSSGDVRLLADSPGLGGGGRSEIGGECRGLGKRAGSRADGLLDESAENSHWHLFAQSLVRLQRRREAGNLGGGGGLNHAGRSLANLDRILGLVAAEILTGDGDQILASSGSGRGRNAGNGYLLAEANRVREAVAGQGDVEGVGARGSSWQDGGDLGVRDAGNRELVVAHVYRQLGRVRAESGAGDSEHSLQNRRGGRGRNRGNRCGRTRRICEGRAGRGDSVLGDGDGWISAGGLRGNEDGHQLVRELSDWGHCSANANDEARICRDGEACSGEAHNSSSLGTSGAGRSSGGGQGNAVVDYWIANYRKSDSRKLNLGGLASSLQGKRGIRILGDGAGGRRGVLGGGWGGDCAVLSSEGYLQKRGVNRWRGGDRNAQSQAGRGHGEAVQGGGNRSTRYLWAVGDALANNAAGFNDNLGGAGSGEKHFWGDGLKELVGRGVNENRDTNRRTSSSRASQKICCVSSYER